MFVATKADHITRDQMPNLVSLIRQIVQEGGRHVEFEGIDTNIPRLQLFVPQSK